MRKFLPALFLLLLALPAWAVDYTALKAEIVKPGYNGMTDTQIANTINQAFLQSAIDVNGKDLQALLYARGKWQNIILRCRAALTATALDKTSAFACYLQDTAKSGTLLQTSNPSTMSQLAADFADLIAAGDLANSDRTAVLALTQINSPLWQSFGGRLLDFNDIKIARAS